MSGQEKINKNVLKEAAEKREPTSSSIRESPRKRNQRNDRQMPVALTIPSCHHCCQKLNNRISPSLFLFGRCSKTMVNSGSSSNNNAGAFTTIKETVTFEKEIKKSKFIAIAGPISNEQSAQSFLSQVTLIYN